MVFLAKEQMIRKSSDNIYLHRDFHNLMNLSVEYLCSNFGEDAVREYLRQFTEAFHKPLKQQIRARGLEALKEYFEGIYSLEEAQNDISISMSESVLEVRILRCPAIAHMKRCGVKISPLFYETTKTIYETLCQDTPVIFTLESYAAEDGASKMLFKIMEA